MSSLVTNITYNQAVQAIREITLDLNPVPCFTVSGQGFPFRKDDDTVTIDTVIYNIDTEMQKLYTMLTKLMSKQVNVVFSPTYVPLEMVRGVINFDYASILEAKTIMREFYFSEETMDGIMLGFFSSHMCYTGQERTTEEIYNDLPYRERYMLCYWTAYWLLDKRRMYQASAGAAIDAANGEIGGELVNTQQEVTTVVGDTFRVVEKVNEGGQGTDGFTSLWGDQYDYWTKMQLYIRQQYESMFGDFSLRDDVMRVSSFSMEKRWEWSAWVDTLRLNQCTRDIFLPQTPFQLLP